MESWLVFLIWSIILVGITIVLKISLSTFMSSLVIGLISADAFLMFMEPYKVSKCEIELTEYDYAKTIILILSGMMWLGWAVYQAFRDNKKHIFCYYCRVKKDIGAPLLVESTQYNDYPDDSLIQITQQ